MADVPHDHDSNGDTGAEAGTTPRWVYGFGIIAITLVLLFVILHFTGRAPDHTL